MKPLIYPDTIKESALPTNELEEGTAWDEHSRVEGDTTPVDVLEDTVDTGKSTETVCSNGECAALGSYMTSV